MTESVTVANMARTPLLVVNIVGLTPGGIGNHTPALRKFADQHGIQIVKPPLPAVTCTSQATLTTGSPPSEHGVISNGWYFRETCELRFWLRSDNLVGGEKLWETARQRDPEFRTANIFWRFCTHAACDMTVTERPTYWADGRKGPDLYTEPAALRDELVGALGEFPLFRFWGPATSIDSTRWIADATLHVIEVERPDLVLTYLPHLDYDVQKFGPGSPESDRAHQEVDIEAGRLIDAAIDAGYDVAVLSEYGMTPVSNPVYLNRVLRDAGFLRVQRARNGELLEPGASRAFAACSHQVAHVYVADPGDVGAVRELLESTPGVERVLGDVGKREIGLDHCRSGELVAVADANSWFAYPYWLDVREAPDFAQCVAIHDKPGHDPVEMFLREGPMNGKLRVFWRLFQKMLGIRAPFDVVSLDATRIRGSHGRLPERNEDHPVLMTTWGDDPTSIAMIDVKTLLLNRLFQQ